MTEQLPLVSVIIPMFNAEKYIEQTLDSLCRQTMKDFEVVIVDDCSTDNSVEVIGNFAKRFGGGLKSISSGSRRTAVHPQFRKTSEFNSLAENILPFWTTTTFLRRPRLRNSRRLPKNIRRRLSTRTRFSTLMTRHAVTCRSMNCSRCLTPS